MVNHTWDPTAPQAQGQDEDSADISGAPDGERVAKALARAGVASRRDVERLIEEGRVSINGRVLSTPAVKVAPGDILTVDGKVVGEAEPTRMWRYHKPIGLVTTHKDPGGRPTVFEDLAASAPGLPRVISVGRLDLNSEGLLLLTNDGALARALELPSTGWMRRYRARAHGRTDQATLDRLKLGVTIEGVRYGPIEARLDKIKLHRDGASPANAWITVSLTEGKNREVRRVLESIGLKVNRLIRLSYGPFQLGVLGAGQVEEIGPRVLREQLEGLILPENMPTGDKVIPIHQPGLKARRAPGQSAAADVLVPPPPEAKPKRKAGWAKPKAKAPFKGKTAMPPSQSGKRPTVIGPKSSIQAPSTKLPPQDRRAAAARGADTRPGAARQDSARSERPRSEHPQRERSRPEGPRTDGPRPEGPRRAAPRSDAPRSGAPKRDPARGDGPTRETSKRTAPRSDSPKADGPRRDGHKPEGFKTGGPKPGGPKAGGPKPGGVKRPGGGAGAGRSGPPRSR